MSENAIFFDVIIVGAGPAGLSTAIELAQQAKAANRTLKICILEKSATIGGHILSGAVLDPRALDELLPAWRDMNCPINTPVTEDSFYYLTEKHGFKLPMLPQLSNAGNYIISLSQLCRWLAEIAENLGVNIFCGFSVVDAIYNESNTVIGVVTGEHGVSRSGDKKPDYQPGIKIYAEFTVLAEGCRGSVSQKIIEKFKLASESSPQTYAIGIKELWEIPADQHSTGLVMHTVGWPLDQKTFGGSFIYHLKPNYLSIGMVVGLDYKNPYLNPFKELQKFKSHPKIRAILSRGTRVSYGARCINEGGFQSIPKLEFPGGVLVGCSAGFVNVPRIKGIHTAMQSGILAAKSIFASIVNKTCSTSNYAINYSSAVKNSWIWSELHSVRNIKPAFRYGLWFGMAYSAIDMYLFRGKTPWTFSYNSDVYNSGDLDHRSLELAANSKKKYYPRPDGKISFDMASSLYLANIKHEHDQPIHLKLVDPSLAIEVNLKNYDLPEHRYCPAEVYDVINSSLQINAQNCLHCKACDIKDFSQNIKWTPPEGGSGPNYINM